MSKWNCVERLNFLHYYYTRYELSISKKQVKLDKHSLSKHQNCGNQIIIKSKIYSVRKFIGTNPKILILGGKK